MKKAIISFLLIPLMLVMFGCGSTDVIRLRNVSYPRVSPHSIRIYLSEEDIKGEYVKLALILNESRSYFTSKEELVKEAKVRASKLGANAIILREIGEYSTIDEVNDEGIEIKNTSKVEIIAIRVLNGNLKEDDSQM